MEPVIWAAVGDPHRRRVLELLRAGPRPVNELVEQLGLSQPGVSKHLRILREAGLVTVRPDGQRRLYLLEPAPLRELARWLEPFRAHWDDRPDAPERHPDTAAPLQERPAPRSRQEDT
ncbi:metalloregulator ArsR/SmtB family transcription factor [Frankia sp. Mgl5]|uniref:ArsR/SmtB family transcription factor n=1 Tax=Frankia sp. Mgl5 TaxID=2933793 RepID=UPI00200FCAB4|nr:metalloregulator ArsR/SmtB family transcription factor [Frankia sp. Mgl5]MCK9929386.1 metalloregulator ArsR/SmtB family transcription factor [Frankia sp. Mgl5]